MVKVWARAGAGSAIKANNTAKTTISTKRARCRPDRASPKSAANDVDAPRHIVKLASDKETVADPNTLLILIQPSCYEAVPSESLPELWRSGAANRIPGPHGQRFRLRQRHSEDRLSTVAALNSLTWPTHR
jgi:hypothetical protein